MEAGALGKSTLNDIGFAKWRSASHRRGSVFRTRELRFGIIPRFVNLPLRSCRRAMPLSLNTRGVGEVTIVRCSGRIVAGETEVLRQHVSELLRDRSDILLHLGEVVFIDSSGLGMLVRLLTSTRSARGDLKLCQVPEGIHKVLRLTNLTTLFDTHESEEEA